jgi:hypothetical protein
MDTLDGYGVNSAFLVEDVPMEPVDTEDTIAPVRVE